MEPVSHGIIFCLIVGGIAGALAACPTVDTASRTVLPVVGNSQRSATATLRQFAFPAVLGDGAVAVERRACYDRCRAAARPALLSANRTLHGRAWGSASNATLLIVATRIRH